MAHRPLLLPFLALAAPALCQESRGPFVGLPAALSVETSAVLGLNGGTTLLKPVGFAAAAPAAFAGRDLATILAGHGAVGLDVDDFSTGLDWIQVDDATGRTLVPQSQWAAITFSVTGSATGAAGSRVAAEAALPGGPGAAVFSYVFAGSALPAPLVGTAERVHSAAELGLPATADIDGLDQLQPMRALQPQIVQQLPAQEQIYFTVPNNALALVPSSWWGTTTPSGATVFVTSTSGLVWTAPTVFLPFSALSLSAGDDIDGLAIDVPNQRILFSLAGGTQDQLLFAYFGTDLVQPLPLKDPNGTPVKTSIGLLQNDDVDAICAMDPSVRQRPDATPNPFFFVVGSPRPAALLPAATLHGSACRAYAGGVVSVHTWTSGWPPLSGQGPGFAAAFLTFGDQLAPVFSLGPAFVRDPTPVFGGDPQHFQLVIPPIFVLGATPVTFRWFAADVALLELAEAFAVRMEI